MSAPLNTGRSSAARQVVVRVAAEHVRPRGRVREPCRRALCHRRSACILFQQALVDALEQTCLQFLYEVAGKAAPDIGFQVGVDGNHVALEPPDAVPKAKAMAVTLIAFLQSRRRERGRIGFEAGQTRRRRSLDGAQVRSRVLLPFAAQGPAERRIRSSQARHASSQVDELVRPAVPQLHAVFVASGDGHVHAHAPHHPLHGLPGLQGAHVVRHGLPQELAPGHGAGEEKPEERARVFVFEGKRKDARRVVHASTSPRW